jgi:hypothetical protein
LNGAFNLSALSETTNDQLFLSDFLASMPDILSGEESHGDALRKRAEAPAEYCAARLNAA